MRALFYDTETSGLPDFGAPSESEHQPHIVQLAAALVDLDTRETIASLDLIVKPDGWVIPAEVSGVHGLTTEHAADVGIPEACAVEALIGLWRAAHTRVGHNESFDARIVRIALKRFQDDVLADEWKAAPAQCTARMATPIVALPPTPKMVAAKRFHHKTPNLGEAYQFFTGQALEGAHSALVDVEACMTVFWAMRDRVEKAVA